MRIKAALTKVVLSKSEVKLSTQISKVGINTVYAYGLFIKQSLDPKSNYLYYNLQSTPKEKVIKIVKTGTIKLL